MILKKVRVSNFRCIDDSGWFSIQPVTCFVGKNESGKTALLQAIEKLKALDKSREKLDKVLDYPRKWHAEYDERNPTGDAVAVDSIWELEAEDVSEIEGFLGEGTLTSRDIHIKRSFDNLNSYDIPMDKPMVIARMAEESGCTPGERESIGKLQTAGQLATYVAEAKDGSAGIENLKQRLGGFRESNFYCGAIDLLAKRMPSFLYFSNYDRMSGRVSIDDLIQRKHNGALLEGQRLFLEFLDFAHITLEDIRDAKKAEELRAKCEAASILISRQIFEYWSQNSHLKVVFVVEAGRAEDEPPFNSGFVMQARILNVLHEMTVPFNERSAGFVWFFSFLVHFSQVKKQTGNVIILLDEPGLSLHAKAQGDLLRYFDKKLKPNYQVLYTTHSPFMVPTGDLRDVRTVEDVVKKEGDHFESLGTHVGDDVLSTDRDTLFPLQAALGYEITQTLFIGEHTVLVEGPSDYLYFVAFSRGLKAVGREALDPRWTICPSGGVDKVSAFLSLFGANKLDIAVVIDYVKGQKAKVDALKRSRLLEAGRVVTFANIVGQPEADVEDMLGPELYANILNSAYELTGGDVLDGPKLGAGQPERLLPKVDAAFRVMPPNVKEFNHYEPAIYLIEKFNDLAGSPGMPGAMDRFERLFHQLNSML